jgi:hypothetical protein
VRHGGSCDGGTQGKFTELQFDASGILAGARVREYLLEKVCAGVLVCVCVGAWVWVCMYVCVSTSTCASERLSLCAHVYVGVDLARCYSFRVHAALTGAVGGSDA